MRLGWPANVSKFYSNDCILNMYVIWWKFQEDFYIADNLPEETTTPTPITTTDDPCECECPNKYEHLTKQNLTYEQLEEALRNETDRLKKELSVDKKSLSSTIRTKISASDDRPSSGVIGWFGGLLIGLQMLFIVSLDVCWCLNKVKLLVTKLFKKDS